MTEQELSQNHDQEQNEVKISSTLGILFEDQGDRRFITIPTEIAKKVGVRQLTRKLHEQVFEGSWPAWSQDLGDYYKIELAGNATLEKIQQFVDVIEAAYKE